MSPTRTPMVEEPPRNEAASRGHLPGHDQAGHRLRLEWGPVGAAAVPADLAVVVDVLSFTTSATVAAERGIVVLPFRWRDERAEEYAAAHDAVLAVGRREARDRPGAVSLSPVTLAAASGVERLVLPSPNGSTIVRVLAEAGAEVVAASLRNAAAVGHLVAARIAAGGSVTVVPAGERWPDGSLRPAVEDLWGAGAVVAAALDSGAVGAGPEALTAAAAWRAVRHDPRAAVRACASGLELAAIGFGDDVDLAAQVDAVRVIPTLRGGELLPTPG